MHLKYMHSYIKQISLKILILINENIFKKLIAFFENN